MKSEPFWTLRLLDGTVIGTSAKKPSDAVLETDYYGELDPALYRLIQDVSARAALRVALISKYLVGQGDAGSIDERGLTETL